MASLTVRRAGPADLERVLELRLALLSELLPAGATAPSVGAIRAFLAEHLEGDAFVVFVGETDRRIVTTGAIALHPAPPLGGEEHHEGYIVNMYTEPAHRGRGYARAVLDALVAHARRRDARKVWLRASAMGRPVYSRVGFTSNPDYMELRLVS